MTFSAFPGVANQALLAVIGTGGLQGIQGRQGVPAINGVTVIAGTSHTLVVDNMNNLLRFTSDDPVSVTIPAGLPENFDCLFLQGGLGAVTVQAGAGVILRVADSATRTAYQWGVAYITPIGDEEYLFGGELEP